MRAVSTYYVVAIACSGVLELVKCNTPSVSDTALVIPELRSRSLDLTIPFRTQKVLCVTRGGAHVGCVAAVALASIEAASKMGRWNSLLAKVAQCISWGSIADNKDLTITSSPHGIRDIIGTYHGHPFLKVD